MNSTVLNSESYYVYSRIYPHRFNWIFGSLIVGLALMLYFTQLSGKSTSWQIYVSLSLTGLVLVWYLWIQLAKLLTYRSYKRFRDEIGFSVNNWDTLVINPLLLKAQHWALISSVEVIAKSSASNNDLKVVQDALLLFITQANQRFYRGIYGDGRIKWVFQSPLKVQGSADVAVTGDMYYLLMNYLKPIQENSGCIRAVNIIWDKEVKYIKFVKRAI